MKYLHLAAIALAIAATAAQAAGVASLVATTQRGERLVIEDRPCIYNGKPMDGAGNAFKFSGGEFVEGCFAIEKGGIVYYLMNDGDSGRIPLGFFKVAHK